VGAPRGPRGRGEARSGGAIRGGGELCGGGAPRGGGGFAGSGRERRLSRAVLAKFDARARNSVPAVLAAVVVGACGGSSAPSPPRPDTTPAARAATPTATPRPPALCVPLNVRKVGTVTMPAATELSGLALSRSGTLWAHNDSGDSPRVFALDRRGRLRREVAVVGAEAVDWEDIAIRGRTLYVGDIGDNLAQRASVTVYRFAEPPAGVTSVAAQRIDLRYTDGAHDAEALLVDPRNGAIAVVTKDVGGGSGVYVASSGQLRKRATLQLGVGQLITAGDVSGDGHTIVLRSYDRAFVYPRRKGESLARALKRDPCVAGEDLLDEGQGESLALTRDGRAFYTVPEGARPALRRYAPY
jgi:hypothetical protein